ncbi:hypothetical protein BDR03DRAFT_1017081 [Suillus americanus]|nr:hypothetical protein BDR03DRAFT_1017081 [Suillus americanus]
MSNGKDSQAVLNGGAPTRKQTAAKKPSGKAAKAKKDRAISMAAQLKMEMEDEDVQQEIQAQQPPATNIKKPPQSGLCDDWHNLVALHVPNSLHPPNSAPAASQCFTGPTKPMHQNSIQSGGFEDEQELEDTEVPLLDSLVPCLKSKAQALQANDASLDNADGADDFSSPSSSSSSSDEDDNINSIKLERTSKECTPLHKIDISVGKALAINTSNTKSRYESKKQQQKSKLKNSQKKRNVDLKFDQCTFKGKQLSTDEMEPEDNSDDNEELMHVPIKVTSSHKNN